MLLNTGVNVITNLSRVLLLQNRADFCYTVKKVLQQGNNLTIEDKNYVRLTTDTATLGILKKNAYLKIQQNSEENTCVTVSFKINVAEVFRV